MAWTATSLSADETAWAASGRPFVSNNAMYDTSVAAGWAVGTISGLATATDDEDGFEAEFTFDGFPSVLSKSDAADTAHTLAYDRSTAPMTLDWLGTVNHNLKTLEASIYALQIADSADFATRPMTISNTDVRSLGSDIRFADLALKYDILLGAPQDHNSYNNAPIEDGTFVAGTGHAGGDRLVLSNASEIDVVSVGGAGDVVWFFVHSPTDADDAEPVFNGTPITQVSTTGAGVGFALVPDVNNIDTLGSPAKRFSGVEHARLRLLHASGVPQIGQVVFGRRRQQKHSPENPYDPTNEHTSVADFDSKAGVKTRNAGYKARRHLDALFRHDTTAEQTDIKEWWDDIEGGEQPWFLVDDPSVDPTSDFWMMWLTNPALMYPFVMADTRDLRIAAHEQGENFRSQE